MRILRIVRTPRDERGLSVLELLVGVTLLSVMSAAAMAMLVSTQNRVRSTSKTTESLDGARTTLTRVEREIRDGAKIYEDSDCPVTTCLTLAVIPPGGSTVEDVRYRYDLASKTVFRTVGARHPATNTFVPAGQEVPMVSHVQNGTTTPVFCRKAPCTTPSETGAVQVTLVVNADEAAPSQGVTLTSYVTPRNQ
ncbi:MAG TPA: hypothetical protein VM841_06440 [Actinomycetota bacterium]|nr:hypothetical protein [Actinomycetota bacterium]